MEHYFRLHSNCQIVNGASTDAIYDLHYGNMLRIKKRISGLIQNDFIELSISAVKTKYPEWVEGLDTYMNFLIEKELAFITTEPLKFPSINMTYETPTQIENAIIEISPELSYEDIFSELINLGCSGFQLIIDSPSLSYVQEIVSLFTKTKTKLVEILITGSHFKFGDLWKLDDDTRFAYKIYGASEAQKENIAELESKETLDLHYKFIEEELDILQKEKYGKDYFYISLPGYIESLEHNIGLNKKVCITRDGSIKNYFTHEKVYGNITKDNLSQIILAEPFKRLWSISNDKVEKCKDCIFKYMCTSYSDLTEKEGKFYKVDTCHYDPLTDVWTEKNELENSSEKACTEVQFL